jgi:hypothetical protein
MSRGGSLNLEDNGNYDARNGTITVYVVTEGDDEHFTSLYADRDFAEFVASDAAGASGEPCHVRELELVIAGQTTVSTAR